MKRIQVWTIIAFAAFQTFGQTNKPVDSRITDVTVFLNKAQVTRKVKTKIEEGKINLILRGLTSQIDPQSIQVSGEGNFIILGITHQQNYLNEFDLSKSLKILNDSMTYLQRQMSFEQSQKDILSKEEQMLITNQKIGGTNQNLTAAELKAMADFYRGRLTDILTNNMKEDEKIKKLSERADKIQLQINEQNELYSRNTSEITVSLLAETPAAVSLEINYVVANAGWTPSYDLRAIDTSKPVQLRYKANVFQGTGEEWNNVKLTLSTANPTQGGLKPELSTWYLNYYQPILRALSGRASGVQVSSYSPEKKDEGIALEESKAGSLANYVNTIQTSLNTEFSISLPYTINSSNKPTMVDIRNYEMKADYLYSVAPKLDHNAFLMARATGWEEFNLLPGEANIFFEGTFIGKSYIDPNSTQDTLAISLGRDKRIVVKRDKIRELSSRRFIGTNQRQSFAYEISARNTKGEKIKIIIEDQIPVSQNNQIEISVTDTGNAKYNKDTGKLVWEMALQPNETRKMLFKFDVKYPKDQQIEGL